MINSPAKKLPATLSFEEAVQATRRRIETVLTGAPPVLRPYTSHLAGAGGKMVRAAALLTCAQNEGERIPADGVIFAAAVELLHLATLVHDDVIDDADTRRGIPTLQRTFGRRTAVICGDYLLSAALALAAGAEDRERYLRMNLPNYMARVCGGEILQQQNNWNLNLTVLGYLRIIRGKTAALFEGAFHAGAVLATEDPAVIAAYVRLGRYVGMIFQLTDDCLDYDADEATALKPVRSDYGEGVVTLPLIRALAEDPALRRRADVQKPDPSEVERAVRRRGGVEYTRWMARRYYDKATAVLDGLTLTPEKRERLTSILEKSYQGPWCAQRAASNSGK